jgi:hypothetical protein
MDDLKALRDEMLVMDGALGPAMSHYQEQTKRLFQEWADRLTSIIERQEKGCMNCGENPAHYCYTCWQGSGERQEKERAFTEAAKEVARARQSGREFSVFGDGEMMVRFDTAYSALTEPAKPPELRDTTSGQYPGKKAEPSKPKETT